MKRSKSREKRAEGIELEKLVRLKCLNCGAYPRKDGDTRVCDHCGYWDYGWNEICYECLEYGTRIPPMQTMARSQPR